MSEARKPRASNPRGDQETPVAELVTPASESHVSDPRWRLIERIASSGQFVRARRLREFLLYVSERALRDPGVVIHEQEIGHAVFGRPADYDTSQDNLVRVQASKLRKRLNEYFAQEGLAETQVLAIPKGGYVPEFRPRTAPSDPPAPKPPPSPNIRPVFVGLVALVVLLAGATGWLVVENSDLRRRAGPPVEASPAAESFWEQFFAGEARSRIILSDANLTTFQDALGRRIRFQEYRSWRGLGDAANLLDDDPARKRLVGRAMSHHFVAMSEVDALRRIEAMGRIAGVWPSVGFARQASVNQVRDGNVILFGNGRVNPWVGLFDADRRFRFQFVDGGADGGARAFFEIEDPRPGESPIYEVRWNQVTYCAIAFLPNHNTAGDVLILEGGDMAATGACATLLTSERWMMELSAKLNRQNARWPAFEVLAESSLVERRPDRLSIVAFRTLGE